MESLRLAFIADRVEPYYHGGYERHVSSLASRLSRSHSVTIFTSVPSGKPQVSGGVRIGSVGPFLRYTRASGSHSIVQSAAFALSALVRLPSLKTFDFVDVLGIPYVQMPEIRVRASLEKWTWGVTIWEAWRNYAFHAGVLGPLYKAGFRASIDIASKGTHPLIVGSVRTKQSLTEGYRIDSGRVFVVPPGIDRSGIEAIQAQSDVADCVYVGRLDSYKRVRDLLLALSILRRTGVNLRCVIAGEGVELGRLRELSTRLGLNEQIQFLGYIDETRKFALLKSAKIFVLPSEREGFSITTLEAITCGACPIVACPVAADLFGTWDLVSKRADDVAYPVGDAERLAARIRLLVTDTDLRRSVVADLRSDAERFDLDNVAATYLRMIDASTHSPRNT